MKTLRLRPGKERSLLRRHPWIFESAIAKGGGDSGETVRVESHEGQFLAWAAFSPSSRIRARVWSFDEAQRIDASFFIAACQGSIRARARFDVQSDGVRLVHGESDGLPGLIVDQYADTLVMQTLTLAMDKRTDKIVELLQELLQPRFFVLRNDAPIRQVGRAPAQAQIQRTLPRRRAEEHALHRAADEEAHGRHQAFACGPPAAAIAASISLPVTGPRNCLATLPSGEIR